MSQLNCPRENEANFHLITVFICYMFNGLCATHIIPIGHNNNNNIPIQKNCTSPNFERTPLIIKSKLNLSFTPSSPLQPVSSRPHNSYKNKTTEFFSNRYQHCLSHYFVCVMLYESMITLCSLLCYYE